MLDRIEVFKAGKHRAVDGKEYAFSEADIAAIAAAYDPALQCGPIVLGHPKTDDPAWGWVKGLAVEGGKLFAETEKVDAAFAEGVEAGRYRYVSSAFYAPDDAANPKPGAWYLRHVGFLGAQPPAVKGLTPAFSEAPADSLVAFAAADADSVQSLFRGLRDWIIEQHDIETADRVVPTWYIDSVEPYVPADAAPAFAEATEAAPEPAITVDGGTGDDVLAARAAELDGREAQIRNREVAFAEGQRQQARQADAEFLDGLVTAGRLPPALRADAAALFAALDGDQTVAFSEPDTQPRAALKKLFEGLGTSIQFAEFSAANGFDGATDPASIAAEIGRIRSEAAERGENLSYSQAAARVGR